MRYREAIRCILVSGEISIGSAVLPFQMTRSRAGGYRSQLLSDSQPIEATEDSQAITVGLAILGQQVQDLVEGLDPWEHLLFEHCLAVSDTEAGQLVLERFTASLPKDWQAQITDVFRHDGITLLYFRTPQMIDTRAARACLPEDANTVSSPVIDWNWNNSHLVWIRETDRRRAAREVSKGTPPENPSASTREA